jgi:hypothetical protein
MRKINLVVCSSLFFWGIGIAIFRNKHSVDFILQSIIFSLIFIFMVLDSYIPRLQKLKAEIEGGEENEE